MATHRHNPCEVRLCEVLPTNIAVIITVHIPLLFFIKMQIFFIIVFNFDLNINLDIHDHMFSGFK